MTELCLEDKPVPSAPGPVLVAVDFSADSRAALLWAARYAAATGNRLLVLHVVHDLPSHPGFYRSEANDALRTLRALAREKLDAFLAAARDDAPGLEPLGSPETLLLTGLPPGRILEASESTGASLLVIGSRGAEGLPQLLQGSVSERVVERARCPVVVVKAPGTVEVLEPGALAAGETRSDG